MPLLTTLLAALLALPAAAHSVSQPSAPTLQTETPAMHEATGSFTVQITP